jgi:2-haloacid dehalogenase
MEGWDELVCFPEAIDGLNRLRSRFKLVVLSNGERDFLARTVKNRIRFDFDDVISVEDVGVFKPNPQVYRYAARVLGVEPQELMMVSCHGFDVVGARVSGYRGAYINRYDLPFDESPYTFDVEARDFLELASKLGCA